jgi:hypothetical protein
MIHDDIPLLPIIYYIRMLTNISFSKKQDKNIRIIRIYFFDHILFIILTNIVINRIKKKTYVRTFYESCC